MPDDEKSRVITMYYSMFYITFGSKPLVHRSCPQCTIQWCSPCCQVLQACNPSAVSMWPTSFSYLSYHHHRCHMLSLDIIRRASGGDKHKGGNCRISSKIKSVFPEWVPFVKPCKNFATNSTLTNCVPKDLQPAKADQAKALTFWIHVKETKKHFQENLIVIFMQCWKRQEGEVSSCLQTSRLCRKLSRSRPRT